MSDLKFALRQLTKHPGFTAVAALTLALGVGANTAIFSVVNSVVLKPLPYHAPEQLVMIWTDNPSLNLGFHELPPSPPDLLDWRRQAQSFEQIAAFRSRIADVSDKGDPERIGGVQATANFFSLLGAEPLLGRTFTSEQEQLGNDKVVVISHGLWQRRFGGDPNVLGQFITVDHERYTVVAVMKPGFNFPRGAEMPSGYALMAQTDIWRPYAEKAEYWRNEDTRDFIAMGRLKPGIALARAQAEMKGLAEREAQASPKTHAGWMIHLRPLSLQVAGAARPVLFILLGAVGFVLLIACANVANLLLCRSAARRKEIAVRAAIGAGRARIVRQLLTESVLLAAAGGAVGLLLGAWGVHVILACSPPNIPRLQETQLDGPVFLFSLLITLATGVLFGLAPAWHASKLNLAEVLNAESRSGTAAEGHRTHRWMVMAEVALAVILLTGAGLMLQSFLRLQAINPGFRPKQVAAFDITLNGAKYADSARQRQFYREARQRLLQIPGVSSVGGISNLPLGGVENVSYLQIEGAPNSASGQPQFAENRKVIPGYFQTMGVSLLQGRDFTDNDNPDQLKVCMINETLAHTYFSGANPIGKRLKLELTDDPKVSWLTIIGVATDVRSYGLDVKPRPQVYTTMEQNTDDSLSFVVRSDSIVPVSLQRSIRAQMQTLDPTMPIANFRTMEMLMADAMARPRFSAFLLGLFAVTALALTAVGLYGVVAYATSQRTREIGIRMALGASRRSVLTLVIRQGMLPALIGLGLGLTGALILTQLLKNQLYEVRATDPWTLVTVAFVLMLVSVGACFIPARRASQIDPIHALRWD